MTYYLADRCLQADVDARTDPELAAVAFDALTEIACAISVGETDWARRVADRALGLGGDL